MKEAIVNTEIVNSLKAGGAWAYKIPDALTIGGGNRFTAEKPCDIVGFYKGKGFAIESKQIKKYAPIGFKMLRPSQVRNFEEMISKGNRAFVFVNVRVPRDPNRLLIFTYESFRDMGALTTKDVFARCNRGDCLETSRIQTGDGRNFLGEPIPTYKTLFDLSKFFNEL